MNLIQQLLLYMVNNNTLVKHIVITFHCVDSEVLQPYVQWLFVKDIKILYFCMLYAYREHLSFYENCQCS